MTNTEKHEWEEKYNEATQRADFFEPNTLVIPINSAILLTRMLLTESIQQAIAEERERMRELFVKLPYMGMIGVSELASGYRKGRADLQKQINDLLDKPLTDK